MMDDDDCILLSSDDESQPQAQPAKPSGETPKNSDLEQELGIFHVLPEVPEPGPLGESPPTVSSSTPSCGSVQFQSSTNLERAPAPPLSPSAKVKVKPSKPSSSTSSRPGPMSSKPKHLQKKASEVEEDEDEQPNGHIQIKFGSATVKSRSTTKVNLRKETGNSIVKLATVQVFTLSDDEGEEDDNNRQQQPEPSTSSTKMDSAGLVMNEEEIPEINEASSSYKISESDTAKCDIVTSSKSGESATSTTDVQVRKDESGPRVRINPTSIPIPVVEESEDEDEIMVVTLEDEVNDETALEVLDDADSKDLENGMEVEKDDFCTDAATNLDELLRLIRPKLSRNDKKTVEKMFWNKYHKLAKEPLSLHVKLSKLIEDTIKKINDLDGLNFWPFLKALKPFFNPENLRDENCPDNIDDATGGDTQVKAMVEKKIKSLEKELNKLSVIIKDLDEKDVDWDMEDDHNSEFMLRDRYMAKHYKVFCQLCKITKSSKQTGRPVQKAMKLTGATKYPEFEKAVERLVNSKGYLTAPDFFSVFTVMKMDKSSLLISESELKIVAQTLHRKVIHIIQHRRRLDTVLAYPEGCDAGVLSDDDPAANDPELMRKLDENKKKGKSVDDVVNEFVIKQEQAVGQMESEHVEVDEENVDTSPPPSDTEDDGDEEDYRESDDDSGSYTSVAEGADEGIPAGEEQLYEDEDEDDGDESERQICVPENDFASENKTDDSVVTPPAERLQEEEANNSFIPTAKPKFTPSPVPPILDGNGNIEKEELQQRERLDVINGAADTVSLDIQSNENDHPDGKEVDITEPPTKKLKHDDDIVKGSI